MRISDWSSDVCSSDLLVGGDGLAGRIGGHRRGHARRRRGRGLGLLLRSRKAGGGKGDGQRGGNSECAFHLFDSIVVTDRTALHGPLSYGVDDGTPCDKTMRSA